MSIIEDKLAELGLKLDAPKNPVANYLGSKQVGDYCMYQEEKVNYRVLLVQK